MRWINEEPIWTGEPMKNQFEWREPPKEGDEFSWLQKGDQKEGKPIFV